MQKVLKKKKSYLPTCTYSYSNVPPHTFVGSVVLWKGKKFFKVGLINH